MRALPVLILSCAILTSCGKSDSGSGPGGGAGASAAKEGGDTPQAVFDRAKSAIAKKDNADFFVCIAPADRDMAVFMFMFMGGMSTMGNADAKKEYEALLKKHGVPEQKEGEGPDMNDKAKMKEALAKMYANVKDKKALFVELCAFTDKHAKDKDTMLGADTSLKDVKEEGNTAKGKIAKKDGKESPIEFAKQDGRWFMVLDD